MEAKGIMMTCSGAFADASPSDRAALIALGELVAVEAIATPLVDALSHRLRRNLRATLRGVIKDEQQADDLCKVIDKRYPDILIKIFAGMLSKPLAQEFSELLADTLLLSDCKKALLPDSR